MRAIILLPFLLAACGQSAPVPAPESSVVQAQGSLGQELAKPVPSTATGDQLQPGQWALTTTVKSVSGGNVTPEMRRQITTRPASYDTCIPADEARVPDANFFVGGSTNECRYSDHDMKDGRIAATIACNATPGTVTTTMRGTYTATTFEAEATTVTSGTSEGDITQRATLEARRIGECRAPQADVRR